MSPASAHALVERPRPPPSEADAASDAVPLPGEQVIDLREPGEFAAGHLPNAINLPYSLLEFRLAADPALARREQPILLYCASGGLATLAALGLQRSGYTAARALLGGFLGWTASGRAVDF
ncbi:rhodanese-like domain-containing protein [Xanthomonas sp. AmX2]|uniref:rhodanese-like domain-containing protein n=1 Tax=Xanthomonas sp. TaxID=29446 RepID=UPI00197D62D5|nr:rhodanese-like domain-containing protein [Xanthomonas sp.]MBN6152300.1 rhodanese-like domain-containing protein [Xanthomonas sp.]